VIELQKVANDVALLCGNEYFIDPNTTIETGHLIKTNEVKYVFFNLANQDNHYELYLKINLETSRIIEIYPVIDPITKKLRYFDKIYDKKIKLASCQDPDMVPYVSIKIEYDDSGLPYFYHIDDLYAHPKSYNMYYTPIAKYDFNQKSKTLHNWNQYYLKIIDETVLPYLPITDEQVDICKKSDYAIFYFVKDGKRKLKCTKYLCGYTIYNQLYPQIFSAFVN
jgi:hypothetical protein